MSCNILCIKIFWKIYSKICRLYVGYRFPYERRDLYRNSATAPETDCPRPETLQDPLPVSIQSLPILQHYPVFPLFAKQAGTSNEICFTDFFGKKLMPQGRIQLHFLMLIVCFIQKLAVSLSKRCISVFVWRDEGGGGYVKLN